MVFFFFFFFQIRKPSLGGSRLFRRLFPVWSNVFQSERHTQPSDTPTPESQLFPLPTRVSPRAIVPTPYNKNQINLALRALEGTPFLSLRRAASIYKVPIKTLS